MGDGGIFTMDFTQMKSAITRYCINWFWMVSNDENVCLCGFKFLGTGFNAAGPHGDRPDRAQRGLARRHHKLEQAQRHYPRSTYP